MPHTAIKKGNRVKFSRRGLALGFGKARSGHYRQHPEERRATVLYVRPTTYVIRLDETKGEQEFAHEYITLAEAENGERTAE